MALIEQHIEAARVVFPRPGQKIPQQKPKVVMPKESMVRKGEEQKEEEKMDEQKNKEGGKKNEQLPEKWYQKKFLGLKVWHWIAIGGGLGVIIFLLLKFRK